jgi:hypothetical protein
LSKDVRKEKEKKKPGKKNATSFYVVAHLKAH